MYDVKGISCTLAGEAGGLGAKTGLCAFGIDKSCKNPRKIDIANCVLAKEDNGVSNRASTGTAIAIPVLTPDRPNKRQNGRRFKENSEPSSTLTAQDRHGVAIDLNDFKTKNEKESISSIWSEKYQCYLTIRKLTPKECFRLQGWDDESFQKAEEFNSNAQLYKQAGNGVTVRIVQAIGEKLKEIEDDKH